MVTTRHLDVGNGDILVLIGTMKGLFFLRSDRTRKSWQMGGPHFPGHSVYSLAYDDRGGRQRLWAGTQSMHWGPILTFSDDFGKTWSPPNDSGLKFPNDTGMSLKQIWQIQLGHPGFADELFPECFVCLSWATHFGFKCLVHSRQFAPVLH